MTYQTILKEQKNETRRKKVFEASVKNVIEIY